MTEFYTEQQTLTLVDSLTETRLTAFIEAEAVVPAKGAAGHMFRQIDIARLELLCEFAELYDMEAESLSVMISLIDQLHDARRDLRTVLAAVQNEPPEVQARIAASLAQAQTEDG